MPNINPLPASVTKPMQGGASFEMSNRLYRGMWGLTWSLLCIWTPRPFHSWRRVVLRLFGASMSGTAKVYPGVRIWDPRNLNMAAFSCLGPSVTCYNMGLLTLDARALVSQSAELCGGSHDIHDENFQLIVKPIKLERDSWIGAGAFVGPGTIVSEGAVVGARAVVSGKILKPWTIYAGNPGAEIGARTPPKANLID